ncbi:Aste57867_15433 [Aphanomyces stellatus]|uniref:Aste57867_15433 protein n=1 Tax=Aphanomyces stellatus TaxID=120398 RepID=A0A485L4G4_9STRA|nr:hypothetical protein As57867_015377 [Aphanomyces stellatus]VFT92235.1 Aste57867_15433 [Aphanomyces stellatus]
MTGTSAAAALPLIHGVTMLENRFLYRRDLGAGTSSIVILALDTQTHANVAIKIWKASLTMAGEREVDILELVAAKRPANGLPIVRLIGSFYYHDRLCIVLEHLEAPVQLRLPSTSFGGHHLPAAQLAIDPDASCTARPKMPRHRLRLMAFHACAALAFVHHHDIIHGDLKPDNILCDNSVVDGSVKLIDFGNALYGDEAESLTHVHAFEVQTLPYRAPEVAVGASLTCAADMWSLGCIVLEGILGHHVFAPHSRADLLLQIHQLFPLAFGHGMYLDELQDALASPQADMFKPIALDALLVRFGIPLDHELHAFLVACFATDPDKRLTSTQVRHASPRRRVHGTL